MVVRENISVYDICWLSYAKGGNVDMFYEPESKEELTSLCRDLYKRKEDFLIILNSATL